MRFDTHAHALLTRKASFDLEVFHDYIGHARQSGLDAMALTEHFNGPDWYRMMSMIDSAHTTVGDHWEIEGVKVFPGMEIDIAEHGHTLVFGPFDEVMRIRRGLDGHTEETTFISAAGLVDLVGDGGAMLVGAHPFRPSRNLQAVPEDVLAGFTAFDLNAKDLVRVGRHIIELTNGLGGRLGIPVIAGGDSHQRFQLGSVWSRFEQPLDTVAELRTAIRAGAYEIEVSPAIDVKVEAGQAMKKLLKRIAVLEGESWAS
ncbi:MAG: PHP-associated domain-containing protein [Acidimicrobiia bacterium]